MQRVTGQSLGDFVRENITGPLGADFHIGTPPEADGRVAHVIPPPPLPMPEGIEPDSVLIKTFSNPDPRRHPVVGRAVAAGRDPGRRRPRQRPLGVPRPHADGVRR